jgi:hypothetical protein
MQEEKKIEGSYHRKNDLQFFSFRGLFCVTKIIPRESAENKIICGKYFAVCLLFKRGKYVFRELTMFLNFEL